MNLKSQKGRNSLSEQNGGKNMKNNDSKKIIETQVALLQRKPH
jgi:hypothetical protein